MNSSADLVISFSGLDSAVSNYNDAAQKFSGAAENINTLLSKTSTYWKDASTPDWQSKIAKAKSTFSTVADKLNNNSAVLNSVNSAVQGSSQNVQKAVSAM